MCANNCLDGTLIDKEPDPGVPFWRCPSCRRIMPVKSSRIDMIRPDEFYYWRWQTINTHMEKKMSGREFNTLLELSKATGYIPDYPMDENNGLDIATTRVRSRDAIDWIDRFVVPVAALLPWGHTKDNPVTFAESSVLLSCLKQELIRLERNRQNFRLQQLADHLTKVAANAFRAVVIADKTYNLGNPILPPGYERYRAYLCEWTAKGCFLGPMVVVEHKKFVTKMWMEKRVWWKNDPFLRG